jgi:predicted nucleotide-binding protein (sugar kinase/HSP70/actin superfamily)
MEEKQQELELNSDLSAFQLFQDLRLSDQCYKARIVAKSDKLNAVYLSNFRCGPDSFLSHFVQEEMRGKPILEIEIDEHSADAGMITRIEAFLDSLKGYQLMKKQAGKKHLPGLLSATPMKGKTLYFPYMNDSAFAIAATCRSFGIDSDVLPMQTEEDLEIGRKYTSSRECFPMICTTGSFLRKLFSGEKLPEKLSFFMPDHNGPCRFGQYNRFQRLLFDRLGFRDTEIISPANDKSYEDISGGHGIRFRLKVWKSFVAVDLLRKMRQERIPYEVNRGEVMKVYDESLQDLIQSLENGGKDIPALLYDAALKFDSVSLNKERRKPVVAVVGEIFMRDNPFCSGHLVEKLEKFGVETWIAPFAEWLTYSTLRYRRDSKWKGDMIGVIKSHIQETAQNRSARKIIEAVQEYFETDKEIEVKDALNSCGKYIHRDYDGDPALNLGTSVILAKKGISGIANILPFTCLPGTVVSAVSAPFKRDHDHLPYVSIAYDGQEDTSINMRLQAFVHQVYQYNGHKLPESVNV